MNRKTATIICVCFPLITLLGCEGITKLEGKITDPQNVPLQNADVKLELVGAVYPVLSESTSDEQGKYEVMLTHAPSDDLNLKLKVSKAGYQTHTQSIKSGTSNRKLNLILKPKAE